MEENEIGKIVVDAAVKVHSALGPGLLESVYEAVLSKELERRGLSVARQIAVPIEYEGMKFDEGFRDRSTPGEKDSKHTLRRKALWSIVFIMLLSSRSLNGHVETFLLSVLQDGPSYGYEIVTNLNERAPKLVNIGEGTVYPVLHRMEKRELLESYWKQSDSGRRRKYYRITDKGRGLLENNLAEWRRLTEAMASITGANFA